MTAGTAAALLYGLGRNDEAEVTERQALAGCGQFLHPIHPRIREARESPARITAGEPPPETPGVDAGPSS
ncbi:hypothetical protein [Streptomyces fagopyri]|uniref:hypothetical protein n=1 Tax=Streptomyces fagopyri TaxID=2662397 RepID=UPI00371829A2